MVYENRKVKTPPFKHTNVIFHCNTSTSILDDFCKQIVCMWIRSGTIMLRFSNNCEVTLSLFERILKAFWNHFGRILGPFWDHFGTILEQFWDHSGTGIILWQFWVHSETILGSFRDHSGTLWDNFGTILGSFWHHFGISLGPSWIP